MDNAGSKWGSQASSRPALALALPVFGLTSALLHREWGRREEEREGPQSPFKADHLCFTKRSDSADEKIIMPNNQGEKKKDIAMSPEVQQDQEGGVGQGGQGQVPAGSSGQAGNVSLWRGTDWLGTALGGLSFKHHD